MIFNNLNRKLSSTLLPKLQARNQVNSLQRFPTEKRKCSRGVIHYYNIYANSLNKMVIFPLNETRQENKT